jgi:AhpD family alkylhydroperoxidase
MERSMSLTQTTHRISSATVKKEFPGIYPAIYALKEAIAPGGLERDLLELVYLRASQINGCAYCVQLHLNVGRELGIPEEKLGLTVVWEEAGIFSEREQAAFAWTEAVTLIAEDHVPDDAYEAARLVFSENELIALTGAIAIINVWNRICGTFRFPPAV